MLVDVNDPSLLAYWRVRSSESSTRHLPVFASHLTSRQPASHHSSNERAASKRVNVGQRLCHAVMSSSRVGCNTSIKEIAALAPSKPSRRGEPQGRSPVRFRGLPGSGPLTAAVAPRSRFEAALFHRAAGRATGCGLAAVGSLARG